MVERLTFTFALTGRRNGEHGTQGVALGSGLVGLSARAWPLTGLFTHNLPSLDTLNLNTLPVRYRKKMFSGIIQQEGLQGLSLLYQGLSILLQGSSIRLSDCHIRQRRMFKTFILDIRLWFVMHHQARLSRPYCSKSTKRPSAVTPLTEMRRYCFLRLLLKKTAEALPCASLFTLGFQ